MSQELKCTFFRTHSNCLSFSYYLPSSFFFRNCKVPPISIFTHLFHHARYTSTIQNVELLKYRKVKAYSLHSNKLKRQIKKIYLNSDTNYDRDSLYELGQTEIMEDIQGNRKPGGSVVRQLKVMNYNVLAQDLVELHGHLYSEHSPDCLTWEYRSRLLMEQITAFLPDILTLQEVQESHIPPFYSQLEKFGYKGIFKRRTGDKTDGCAIYYMSSLLELVEYRTVEYFRPHISPTLLNRPNVAIIARLRPNSSAPRIIGRDLIVANTHLLYNPNRNDVRLAQTQILLAEINNLIKNVEPKEPAILLMGDLNSLPNSPIIKLLEEGRISYIKNLPPIIGISNQCTYKNHEDEKKKEQLKINGESCNLLDQFKKVDQHNSQVDLSHCFDFKSVYDWKNKYDHQLATTFQGSWVIVDYMFYSKNLKLISRLKLPTVYECECDIGWIPNNTSPSDHFPLAATFLVE